VIPLRLGFLPLPCSYPPARSRIVCAGQDSRPSTVDCEFQRFQFSLCAGCRRGCRFLPLLGCWTQRGRLLSSWFPFPWHCVPQKIASSAGYTLASLYSKPKALTSSPRSE
jgi:hypothetical protein